MLVIRYVLIPLPFQPWLLPLSHNQSIQPFYSGPFTSLDNKRSIPFFMYIYIESRDFPQDLSGAATRYNWTESIFGVVEDLLSELLQACGSWR